MALRVPRRRFTVEEFHQMADARVFSEDDRVELLEGEIIEMAPIGSRHAACVDRLNRILTVALGDQAIVRVQSPLRLSERSEPQPDLAVLRPRTDFYAGSHPSPTDVLLVVEVAEASAGTDREIKVPLYARAGIPEVWLIDLDEAVVEAYAHPTVGMYGECHRQRHGQTLIPRMLPSIAVPVSQILP